MTTISLREPFFLSGHRGMLFRATMMSVVIGALASAAAWIDLLGFAAVRIAGVALTEPWQCYALLSAAGLPPAILVVGPLNYWNHRPWSWTLLAVIGLPVLIFVCGMTQQLMILKDDAVRLMFFSGCGLLLVRWEQKHRLAFLLSCFVGSFGELGFLQEKLAKLPSYPLVSFGLVPVSSILSDVIFWAVAVAVPWGIPFWEAPSRKFRDHLQTPHVATG